MCIECGLVKGTKILDRSIAIASSGAGSESIADVSIDQSNMVIT